jgi:two-component system, chemotaxis family, sensor histidine kinase and response regulator PixL
MITSDREQQIRLQFLEEATDYLDSIESGLIGLGTGEVSGKELDAILRAAHSIKGGAGMMGFTTLARLGHHLEDYFKIIQYGKAAKPDPQLEQLLLKTVDKFRQIVALNRQGKDAEEGWLSTQVDPIFAKLRDILGDFNPEDEANMLASESGEDILTFLFESEVERCLTDLETTIDSGTHINLFDELMVATEELGGLAEMVELPAFASLCRSVSIHLESQPHQIVQVAALAVSAWRRTQAMVLIGQTANLPIEIELPGSGIPPMEVADELPDWSTISLNESESPANLAEIDLDDFSLNSLNLEDLDIEDRPNLNDSISIDWQIELPDLSTLADPFGTHTVERSPSFSTITNSGDLFDDDDPDVDLTFDRADSDVDEDPDLDITFDQSDSYAEDSTEEDIVIASNFDVPTDDYLDAFDRVDMSGDLSIEADDAIDLFSALAAFPVQPSGIIAAKPAPSKQDEYLAQEINDLFTALDAAPEVPGESYHQESPSSDNSAAASQVAEQTIRVATKQLEQLGDLFGELTIDRNGLNLQLKGIRQLVATLHTKVQQLEQSNTRLRNAYATSTTSNLQQLEGSGEQTHTDTWTSTLSNDLTSQFDLLEFDRYSELQLLSQDVMDTIVQIEEISTDLDFQLNDTERTTRDLNRTAKQLQTGLTQVRMRPVSDLFNRFPRAIRNLSIQHAKPIDLKFKGGTTLIERSVLEALNDPLMHLVRNAFDHGIEPSAVRRASGKSDMGTIEIAAMYRGDRTVITIKDDGGGIDLDKIRAKVKKMGVDDKQIKNFKDSELLDLIFEPGFSTAEKVTDLSGRGVGMDVVRTNIRSLNGDIIVDTKPGEGSTFTITVPFTLSVVRVLLVEIKGLWLAVPSNIVEEVILLNPEQIVNNGEQEMLQWEGFSIRLIAPHQYLHLPYINPQLAANDIPTIGCPTVLTIDLGQDVVGIEIDKFWGEQEVTVRQPQGKIKMPPGFTGCTILGDGRVVPLLDAIEFVRWIDTSADRSNKNIQTLASRINFDSQISIVPQQRPRILVVDDSINVRRFVALTLEKSGYQVEQAKDGQEAIEKLQAGLSAQAVVCDIEMPRMDGYGFLASIKSQSQFKNIPVLMLTSRSGDKHRKIAMNLGATGYFSKPFKEQDLLATLTELVGR